jgi:hypothetical protein
LTIAPFIAERESYQKQNLEVVTVVIRCIRVLPMSHITLPCQMPFPNFTSAYLCPLLISHNNETLQSASLIVIRSIAACSSIDFGQSCVGDRSRGCFGSLCFQSVDGYHHALSYGTLA